MISPLISRAVSCLFISQRIQDMVLSFINIYNQPALVAAGE